MREFAPRLRLRGRRGAEDAEGSGPNRSAVVCPTVLSGGRLVRSVDRVRYRMMVRQKHVFIVSFDELERDVGSRKLQDAKNPLWAAAEDRRWRCATHFPRQRWGTRQPNGFAPNTDRFVHKGVIARADGTYIVAHPANRAHAQGQCVTAGMTRRGIATKCACLFTGEAGFDRRPPPAYSNQCDSSNVPRTRPYW